MTYISVLFFYLIMAPGREWYENDLIIVASLCTGLFVFYLLARRLWKNQSRNEWEEIKKTEDVNAATKQVLDLVIPTLYAKSEEAHISLYEVFIFELIAVVLLIVGSVLSYQSYGGTSGFYWGGSPEATSARQGLYISTVIVVGFCFIFWCFQFFVISGEWCGRNKDGGRDKDAGRKYVKERLNAAGGLVGGTVRSVKRNVQKVVPMPKQDDEGV
jgi:preprotein translocase subunit SecG